MIYDRAHGGSYCIYRALAVAIGELSPSHKPDFTNTLPSVEIGPYPQWGDSEKIVSIDPFGHVIARVFDKHLRDGLDIRPSIAITKAHMRVPEIEQSIREGRMRVDNKVVVGTGDLNVVKGAVEPVWFLPGVAKRFGVDEVLLRRCLLSVFYVFLLFVLYSTFT